MSNFALFSKQIQIQMNSLTCLLSLFTSSLIPKNIHSRQQSNLFLIIFIQQNNIDFINFCSNLPSFNPCTHPLPSPSPCTQPLPRSLPSPNPCTHLLPSPSPCTHPLPSPSPCTHPLPSPSPCTHPLASPSPCTHPLSQ
jgi:hypothetical protein